MRIAVIGSGVSGLVAARLLSCRGEVYLFESGDQLGGHAHTVDVEVSGVRFPVDVGFMVFNDRTYPQFGKILDWLGVKSRPSDMSFSVSCAKTGLEYEGSSLSGIFAQRRNVVRPRFLYLLRTILRFHYVAARWRSKANLDALTIGELLRKERFEGDFVRLYLIPMTAAIWSSNPDEIMSFPARFLLDFFHNHGLVQIFDRPIWRTVVGGSREYVQRIAEPLQDRVILRTEVDSVLRSDTGVEISVNGVHESFDAVVLATHSDTALGLLKNPLEKEREILESFPYQSNSAVLHTDIRKLPRNRRAWASWNYFVAPDEKPCATVTYDLSRLQGHSSEFPILLTLNDESEIAPERIIKRFRFAHPQFQLASIGSQGRHSEISGIGGVYYCGAYWHNGFHEDGVRSGLRVAAQFGIDLDSCIAASSKESYNTRVSSR